MELPDNIKAMLDGANFAHLATIMEDGSPQATMMWVDREGDHVRFNTVEGRVKPTNLRNDPRVAISIYDESKPYLNAAMRGKVIEFRHEGAEDHIHALSNKYKGKDFSIPAGSVRVMLVVEIESIGGYAAEES
ncbi:MAG: PPOX class F420-dependent oxidoreductase [Acidimicrobiia bacterium]|nr:PPOX class F420-dependent oxidoreductase [Acidimicrobiia bacterium]